MSIQTHNKSVLVIDDDPLQCTLLQTLLGREGMDVQCCHTGYEGLEYLKDDSYDQYDLLILDLMLPDISGYSILQKIQQGGYQQVPTLILSAKSMDEGTKEMICEQANVRDYHAKPVDLHKLRNDVHQLLGTQTLLKTTPAA